MITALASRKGNSNRTAEAFARVTASLQAAEVRHRSAKQAWEEALSDEALSLTGDKSRSDQLEGEMNVAQREVSRLQAAAKVLEIRQAADVSNASHAFEVERWAQAEALAEERNQAASQLAKSAAAFAGDYHALFKATAGLTAALPSIPDMEGAALQALPLEIVVRKELFRLGLPWAIHWPWGAAAIPNFEDEFRHVPNLVRQWRDAALNKGTAR